MQMMVTKYLKVKALSNLMRKLNNYAILKRHWSLILDTTTRYVKINQLPAFLSLVFFIIG